jgi:membrane-bound lytic murein transglycosylase B
MTQDQAVPVKRKIITRIMNKSRRLLGGCKAPLYLAAGGFMMSITASFAQADYLDHPEAQSLINELVAEEGFQQKELEHWLGKAEKKQNILDAIARPAEKTKTWKEYRPIFIVQPRIDNGVKFWQENHAALSRAERELGVPAEYIVAIIGVETNYGKNTGSYNVIDALSTLAFDYPPRAPFFRKELKNYFLLTREQKQDPLAFKGSYAGAMGFGQFMPSSYRAYAVDFDGDGFTDIWNNTTDAIGSVANYFKQHGWQPGETVVSRVRPQGENKDEVFNQITPPITTVAQWQTRGFVPINALPSDAKALILKLDGQHGEEYWLGLQNFYVISRYNRSHLYSMAVHQLSQLIKNKMEMTE